MTLAHIVAAAQNNVIGKDNNLPWNIPEDLKFFRDKTMGHAMIMGRKTFESVGHPLPKRLSVIVTRKTDYQPPKGTVVVNSLEAAIDHCRHITDKWGEEVFILGGGEIFRQSLSLVDIIYLTRIHKEFDGDITYPEIPTSEFVEVERRDRKGEPDFSFLTYARK